MQHDEIAKKMSENGRKAVEKKYNWSIEEEKLIKVYQKIGQSNFWAICIEKQKFE